MTLEQIAVAGYKALDMYEAEAKERQRLAGLEHSNNLKFQTDERLTPELEQADTEPTKREPTAIEHAAAFGVIHCNAGRKSRALSRNIFNVGMLSVFQYIQPQDIATET
jgi:hypothetical protein